MDEQELLLLEEDVVYQDIMSSDDEYAFQFELDDKEYDEVLKELNAGSGDDDEGGEETERMNCPHEGCKRSFCRKHNLIKHLKSHELGLDKAGSVCHICGKHIKGVYSLHLKIHENTKQFHCDDCGRSFRQKIGLHNHMLIHRNEKPHECPYCAKRFRQKYTMDHHMKNRHTGIKDHICDLCGKEFSDRASLQKHTLVHSTNKPHQCTTCFMSFRHKSSLSRHSKIHLKVTQCEHCHRSFRYESFLKKHLLTAHKDVMFEDKNVEYVDEYVDYKEEIKHEDSIAVITFESPQMVQIDGSAQPLSIPMI